MKTIFAVERKGEKMRLIDANALYEQLKQDEEMARNRVLDTESSLPYPNNLNPSYTRYVAQMDERTRLKHMVADAPTIQPEPLTISFVREIDKETADKIKRSMARAPVMLLAIEQEQTCDGCQCPEQMCENCKRAYSDKYVGGEAG